MAGAAGDRREMDDAVGRAADRLQHDHGVAQRGRRDDLAGQRRAARPPCAAATRPEASAERTRSACGAGIEAAKATVSPSVSAMIAMVLAVPITMQVPTDGASLPLTSSISASSMSPAR